MIKEAKEHAEADFLWAECQMDDMGAELFEIEKKKQKASEEVAILSSAVKSARQDMDFLRAEREEIAGQIKEYRNNMYDNALNEKEYLRLQKESQKASKRGKNVVLQQEEYERLIHSNLLEANLKRREERLEEEKKDIEKNIQERIKRRFPEELQKIAEAEEYWNKNVPVLEMYAAEINERAIAVAEKEMQLFQKEQEINEREESLIQKEKDLDAQMESCVEERVQQKIVTFMEKVKGLVYSLISAIADILTPLIPIPIMKLIESKLSGFIDDLECALEEKEIELDEQGE